MRADAVVEASLKATALSLERLREGCELFLLLFFFDYTHHVWIERTHKPTLFGFLFCRLRDAKLGEQEALEKLRAAEERYALAGAQKLRSTAYICAPWSACSPLRHTNATATAQPEVDSP